jgi:hypothetical protein
MSSMLKEQVSSVLELMPLSNRNFCFFGSELLIAGGERWGELWLRFKMSILQWLHGFEWYGRAFTLNCCDSAGIQAEV